MAVTAAQNAAQLKYDAQNTRQYKVKLNTTTDADLIEYLDGVPNKQGTIKAALREYIERRKSMYTKQDVELMIEDYLADHPEYTEPWNAEDNFGYTEDEGPLVVDYDTISYDTEMCCWAADAYDKKCQYVLVADDEGNVRIEFIGIR